MIIPTEINSRLSVPRRIMLSNLGSYTPWCPHIQAQMAATQKAIDLASELYSGKLLTSSQLASYLQVTRRTIEICGGSVLWDHLNEIRVLRIKRKSWKDIASQQKSSMELKSSRGP